MFVGASVHVCVCVWGGGVKGEGDRGDVGKVCLCTDLGVLATFSVERCFESKYLYYIYMCVCMRACMSVCVRVCKSLSVYK